MITPRTRATATPFGPERALEIWEQRGPQWDVSSSITPGEDEYVREIWNSMPANRCWMDAFLSVLHDECRPFPCSMCGGTGLVSNAGQTVNCWQCQQDHTLYHIECAQCSTQYSAPKNNTCPCCQYPGNGPR